MTWPAESQYYRIEYIWISNKELIPLRNSYNILGDPFVSDHLAICLELLMI